MPRGLQIDARGFGVVTRDGADEFQERKRQRVGFTLEESWLGTKKLVPTIADE